MPWLLHCDVTSSIRPRCAFCRHSSARGEAKSSSPPRDEPCTNSRAASRCCCTRRAPALMPVPRSCSPPANAASSARSAGSISISTAALPRTLDGTGCVNERVETVNVELGPALGLAGTNGAAALTARGWGARCPPSPKSDGRPNTAALGVGPSDGCPKDGCPNVAEGLRDPGMAGRAIGAWREGRGWYGVS